MTFNPSHHPRNTDGQFTEKTGSAAEVSLDEPQHTANGNRLRESLRRLSREDKPRTPVDDLSGSFDFSAFQPPPLSRVDNAGPENPITDERLTESAKARLGRLVAEYEVTAVVNDGPTMEAPVTMLYVGNDAFFHAGDNPGTNEEALANVARLAANGNVGATSFLHTALDDEADDLIELVAEERL